MYCQRMPVYAAVSASMHVGACTAKGCPYMQLVKLSGAGERQKRSRIPLSIPIPSKQQLIHFIRTKTIKNSYFIFLLQTQLPNHHSTNHMSRVEPTHQYESRDAHICGLQHQYELREQLYALYQANHHIYASHIMHTSRGACSKQPTQVLP